MISLGGFFDYDGKKETLDELELLLAAPEVWEDLEKSKKLSKERSELSRIVSVLTSFGQRLEDSQEVLQMSLESEDESLYEELHDELIALSEVLDKLEFERMFSGEMDQYNAYIDIQSGSGGTEAQDWAEMLLRMYCRFCESKDFNVEVTELTPGDVAGIKSATILCSASYAFGWLRTETGVHRLVRKSPFDSGNRRHTSFASVFVYPEVDDDIEVDINMAEVRVDTYRSSGAGGQHVNTTDSAIRLTHLPTNIVVQCQSERSQHQNKDRAMKQLKAKLYEVEMQKRRSVQQELEDSKSEIGWGNQIRSYVLDQSRIKDLRTNVEITNTTSVLDGALDKFVEASLKLGL